MEGQVSWIIELAVKPGELAAFEELMAEMVEGTSTEPPTLNYEWHITADESVVHIYEKYADSEAMVAHVSGFLEKWASRFMSCVDVTRFTVYGSPNAAAREMLDGFGPTYMGPWGGFAR